MINLILWAILGATTLWIASTIIGGERSRMVNCVICAIGAAVGEIAMLVMNTVTGASGFSFYSFLIGLTGVLILWAGLGQIFPDSANLFGFTLRYIRYALTGAWISVGAPCIFLKLGLAEKRK